MNIVKTLSTEFKLNDWQVENVIALIEEGNTIPFIARYRKEQHGELDDQVLRVLDERFVYLTNLKKRKEDVAATIIEQEKMTEEIQKALDDAQTMTEVEDIYRPYKPKRRTRGTVAREKGLEPLAQIIMQQDLDAPDPLVLASEYIDEEKEVLTAEDALQGAMDIIAEDVSDDAELRKKLRTYFLYNSILKTLGNEEKQKDDEITTYQMYNEFSEPVRVIAGHRVLAINRAEKEGYLSAKIETNRERALDITCYPFVLQGSKMTDIVEQACIDGYDRLIFPSIEREIRNTLTEKASSDAIMVFGVNLRNLLLQPPLKGNTVLGLDPGFRTGSKLAVVDSFGKVLDINTIYQTPPHNKVAQATTIVLDLIKKHDVKIIAIGNGTASRESEAFVADLIAKDELDIAYVIVNEAGASVYSASKLASQEFPDFDVSIRSAVSIARRLQDPLAELVKIDPKSIGVGQYQHDMPPAQLDSTLGAVVEDAVNSVGVNVNTASAPLLSFVAGINITVAKNIVKYREENGAFNNRKILNDVPRLGAKSFEQAAGFLRVADGDNILDNTGVHPETYKAATKMIEKLGYTLDDVKTGNIAEMDIKAQEIGKEEISNELEIGIPTLNDIIKELLKPGRDPRDDLPQPELRKDVLSLEDIEEGMELSGTVRNVVDFGAFVDIGVHEDGLVHISELSDKFIKHPLEAVKVGDIVNVKVISIDLQKKRVGLSMKGMNL